MSNKTITINIYLFMTLTFFGGGILGNFITYLWMRY